MASKVRDAIRSSFNSTALDKDWYLPFSGLFDQTAQDEHDFVCLTTRHMTILRTTTGQCKARQ